MRDLGKIDTDAFDRVIATRLGAVRDDVVVGPQPGVDFGVLSVDDTAVVLAADPLSILPELGIERAARLATDVALADVAVSGLPPTHLAVSLTLRTDWDTDTIASLWRGIQDYASELGSTVLAEHVGRYPGVESSWVGSATGLGVGEPERVVRPDGSQPGDALVVSTGPAAEVAGLFSTRYPDALGLDAETVASAQERVGDIFAVEDALAAHRAGRISAMHDATEGGLARALVEMATGAGVRFEIDSDTVPIADGVAAVCGAIDVDPWHVTSCGTLVTAVAPEDAPNVVSAFEGNCTPAAVVGRVTAGEGVVVDGEAIEAPARDPSWAAAEGLAEGSGANSG